MSFERSSGILVHPTSFPSAYGIGDLGKGAYAFIDFLEKSNQKLWQILPLGPTSFGDSPYQSFSTFAGNPLLISPDHLVSEGYLLQEDLSCTPPFDPHTVDYGPLIEYKSTLYKRAFERFRSNASSMQRKAFDAFCLKNQLWLDDYCLFVSLKDHFIRTRKTIGMDQAYTQFAKTNEKYLKGNALNDYYFGAVWSTWDRDLAERNPESIQKWTALLADEISYYKFLQYEFFREWTLLKEYANQKHIQVIGDIPIFVAYDSADVWANPDLFYLDSKGYPTIVAGVPPDYFSVTGQLWGNPLYNWEAHKKNNYGWWIERVKEVLKLVDIVRIDHFRGFEAYWAVPYGEETAIHGEWRKGPEKDLFHAIEKSLGKLPIIAEDLGLITPGVIDLRDTFEFPGMKILQFAFDSSEENNYIPHNFIPNTVVYTGTHDNDTTVGWYGQAAEKDRDLVRRYMNVSGEDIAWDFIRLAFASVANMSIVPLQDVMSLDSDARMNIPGVASGNWKWRYTSDMLREDCASRLAYLTKIFGR